MAQIGCLAECRHRQHNIRTAGVDLAGVQPSGKGQHDCNNCPSVPLSVKIVDRDPFLFAIDMLFVCKREHFTEHD